MNAETENGAASTTGIEPVTGAEERRSIGDAIARDVK